MRAYKCDRCGALFQPTLNSPEFELRKYQGEWEYETLDLCDDCIIDLKRFMKEAHHDNQ